MFKLANQLNLRSTEYATSNNNILYIQYKGGHAPFLLVRKSQIRKFPCCPSPFAWEKAVFLIQIRIFLPVKSVFCLHKYRFWTMLLCLKTGPKAKSRS